MIGSLLIFTPTSLAAEPIKIKVKNEQIQTDTPPLFEKGRVLIPIRAVAESLDANVAWESKTKTATVSKWSKKIDLTVGKKIVYVEGDDFTIGSADNTRKEISIDVPVKNVNSRVYIPLRVVSETLGYDVHWANNTVFINAPKSKWGNYFHGNLDEARKIALSITSSDLQFQHKPLDANFTVVRSTYLFPEGEALQFHHISGDLISFIQFKDDFPIVVWQGRFQEADPIQGFVNRNFTEQRGTAPAPINKPHLYYSSGIFGVTSTVQSGQIAVDGTILETGYKHKVEDTVVEDRGTISLTMPDEKRVD